MIGAVVERDIQRAGDYVIARRGQLRMTQEQLASNASVNTKTIYNLEAGLRWPWAENRSAIEEALGWPPMTLEMLARGGEPPTVFDAAVDRKPGLSDETRGQIKRQRRRLRPGPEAGAGFAAPGEAVC